MILTLLLFKNIFRWSSYVSLGYKMLLNHYSLEKLHENLGILRILKSPFRGSEIPLKPPNTIQNIFIGNDRAKKIPSSVFEHSNPLDLAKWGGLYSCFNDKALLKCLYSGLIIFSAFITETWQFDSGVLTGNSKAFTWHDLAKFVFICCVVLLVLPNRWTIAACSFVNELSKSHGRTILLDSKSTKLAKFWGVSYD